MLRFLNKRSSDRSHGPNLRDIVNDASLLRSGTAPRFPPTLLAAESKVDKALQAGDQGRLHRAIGELADAIITQLASDGQRLRELGDSSDYESERDFLCNRILALDIRLGRLEQPSDTVHTAPKAPVAVRSAGTAVALADASAEPRANVAAA